MSVVSEELVTVDVVRTTISILMIHSLKFRYDRQPYLTYLALLTLKIHSEFICKRNFVNQDTHMLVNYRLLTFQKLYPSSSAVRVVKSRRIIRTRKPMSHVWGK
jgi:hypothetical protein